MGNTSCESAKEIALGDTEDSLHDLPETSWSQCFPWSPVGVKWFSVMGVGGLMQASTCESCGDSAIVVYRGDNTQCDSLQCVGVNDDSWLCNCYASIVKWCGFISQSYLIAVAGYQGAEFEFTLQVTDLEAPCVFNDLCSYAVPTPQLPFTHSASTMDATSNAIFCGVQEKEQSVWFEVQGTGNRIRASTCISENLPFQRALSVNVMASSM